MFVNLQIRNFLYKELSYNSSEVAIQPFELPLRKFEKFHEFLLSKVKKMVQIIQKELHEEQEKNKDCNVIEATHSWKKSADTTWRKPKKTLHPLMDQSRSIGQQMKKINIINSFCHPTTLKAGVISLTLRKNPGTWQINMKL